MTRLKLVLAYDGRPYAGWQVQPGKDTVQSVVEEALTRILKGRQVRIHGSGRTDTGVHALGQVAHFDVPDGIHMPAAIWRRSLNAYLPLGIRVMDCAVAAPGFHSRIDAVGKTYRYRLFMGEVLPPLEAGIATHHPKPLDDQKLAEACAALEGTHNFAGFAAFRGNEDGTEDTVRTLRSVRPVWEGDFLTITWHGTGFLYKMVRLLTAAVLRVGAGREPLSWLTDLLHRQVPGKCQHVAPADGLYLVGVDYPESTIAPHDTDDSRPASR
ncbi:MAG: tRNA pseudouridine synthase [Verrucomicrobiales bacterium]|nr:tRNA pseudouridine synthase [Verrucomicrobiales bacterium]